MPGDEHRVVERIDDGSFEMDAEFHVGSILDVVRVEESDGTIDDEQFLVECTEDWSVKVLSVRDSQFVVRKYRRTTYDDLERKIRHFGGKGKILRCPGFRFNSDVIPTSTPQSALVHTTGVR